MRTRPAPLIPVVGRSRIRTASAAALSAACENHESSTLTSPNPTDRPVANVAPGNGTVAVGEFEICKFGATATFDVFYDDVPYAVAGPLPNPLTDEPCEVVAMSEEDLLVRVVENVPDGFEVEKILVTTIVDGVSGEPEELTNTLAVSGTINESTGILAEFFNFPSVNLGGEGCTPGYWKQKHHFDSWSGGLSPDDLFSDVFVDAFPGLTLLQVLKQGGGGLNALGRHTVAALLNASSADVSYQISAADVILGFNQVFPGEKDSHETLKDDFAAFNEQGCPLN